MRNGAGLPRGNSSSPARARRLHTTLRPRVYPTPGIRRLLPQSECARGKEGPSGRNCRGASRAAGDSLFGGRAARGEGNLSRCPRSAPGHGQDFGRLPSVRTFPDAGRRPRPLPLVPGLLRAVGTRRLGHGSVHVRGGLAFCGSGFTRRTWGPGATRASRRLRSPLRRRPLLEGSYRSRFDAGHRWHERRHPASSSSGH